MSTEQQNNDGDERPSEARPALEIKMASLPALPRKATSAPVAALRMERLVLWVIGRVEDFPRKHRFTVGDKWVETCLQIQTDLLEATYIKHKKPLLLSASRGLTRARVLARMAVELMCVSLQQGAYFQRESGEIGKMTGGWVRSLNKRNSQPPTQSVETEL